MVALLNKAYPAVLTAAFLLLALSPTNGLRRGVEASTPGLIQLLSLVLTFAIKFFARTFRDQPIPTFYSMLLSALLAGALLYPLGIQLKTHVSLWRTLLWTGLLLGIILGLIAITAVPFVYVQSAVPELRAQIVARYIMTLGLCLTGGMIGLYTAGRMDKLNALPSRAFQFGAMLVLLVAALYPVRAAYQVYQTTPKYQKWAAFWDERHHEIQAARDQGILDVQVIQIDHIIDQVGDLSPDPAYWYYSCAAMYYHVQSIRADLPGWDP